VHNLIYSERGDQKKNVVASDLNLIFWEKKMLYSNYEGGAPQCNPKVLYNV
jgi:hypothetical protein